ncbi:MAG: flagellar filament capping protein FliD [Planctomycetota bacterium]|nr:flagellar filament capping protein FliD [Planctomycetota bacterium]
MAVSISGITLSGVFSSIDTDKLVQASLLGAQGPLNRLTTQKTKIQAQQKAMTDLQGRLSDLQDITDKLSTAATSQAVSASSSSTAVLSASASGSASEGSFAVTVNQLATAQRLVETTGKAGTDSLVGAGQLVYSYGGQTITRATTATTTLAGLRDLINNDSSNPGVTASLLNVNGTYHLVLSGKDTGAGHTITIDDVQTTLAGFDTGDFTQTQGAQNAQIRVDGFPAATWIERDSNRVVDAIPGVTLNLTKPGDATVTLTQDTSTISSDLKNLVSIYNGLVAQIGKYTGYDSTNKTAGVLQGDITVRTIAETARRLLSGALPGTLVGTDTYTLAGDIGLSIDRYGTLSLDDTKLTDALANDYAGVLKFIGASGNGRSDNQYIQYTSAASSVAAGQYSVEVQFDNNGTAITARIKAPDEDAWQGLDIQGSTLMGKTGTTAAGLVLTTVGQGAEGTLQTGKVYVQKGLAGQMNASVAAMLETDTGTIDVSEKRLDTQLADVNKKIEQQNTYLDNLQTTLKDKYARMEAALASLESTKGQFDAMFSALDANANTKSS